MVLTNFSALAGVIDGATAVCRKMHFGEHEIGMEVCIQRRLRGICRCTG